MFLGDNLRVPCSRLSACNQSQASETRQDAKPHHQCSVATMPIAKLNSDAHMIQCLELPHLMKSKRKVGRI